VDVLTVGGEVQLSRRYFWSGVSGGIYPVDDLMGLDAGCASAGARDFCCSMGIVQDFGQGAEDLARITGLRVSPERLRQITEREGQAVAQARSEGTLPPAWSARDATVDSSRRTRLYVGVDGVKVRTVTQEEKEKRRRDQVIRRQQRGRVGAGNTQALPPARPGSDQPFKEFKIGLFYDQDRTHIHAFATHEDHTALGELLGQHAETLGWSHATEKISLTDGAPWIRNQILAHLQPLDATLLDFYHLSEHVWAAARACLGEGEVASTWAEGQLHALKHTGARSVLAAIDDLRKKARAPAKLESLRLLRQYILERWEMVEYRQALARGWDIGSGPTEAMCKNLTLRLKRPGMKWDADHAAAMMNLIALKESGQWADYWRTRKVA
jgi:hypothetical protein